jgi:hypothetical protein
LSASGEFIAFVDSNGLNIIDSLAFGPQTTDISWGRSPDGSNYWELLTPTPGSSNQALELMSMPSIPERFALHQNFPNPFNPTTKINYALPRDAHVRLVIYDLRGRLVTTLVDEYQTAGYKNSEWNATIDNGLKASAGLYIYSLQVENFRGSRKFVLLK